MAVKWRGWYIGEALPKSRVKVSHANVQPMLKKIKVELLTPQWEAYLVEESGWKKEWRCEKYLIKGGSRNELEQTWSLI